ncbi:MAG: homoserine dehydrogenase [Acidobacteria bacterium]|nr:homoserine dehydrogenase [Acidobacteriota bacterium]MBV9480950.1 homoserine dehydrogenase [Acidobacteriota bacterium]
MQRIGVGVVGYGTVGRATAEIIAQHADLIERRSGVRLEITAVCRRSQVSPEEVPAGARTLSSWKQLVHDEEVDVLVETMGGVDEARQLLVEALTQGKPVVTANKNLLAHCGDELFRLAASRNLPIGFEASVAGGIPILRGIRESTAGDRLRAVRGILNGTANYILTQMESRGIEFAEALAEAQKAGYAEADPSFDIDGLDARDKLCILARMAFSGKLTVDQIPTCGIRRIRAIDFHTAGRLKSTIRLVGAAELTDGGLEISVRPWLVKHRSLLANVADVNNAIFLVGEHLGTLMFYGRGAGGGATGAAAVSDVIEIASDLAAGQLRAKQISGFLESHELRICSCPCPVGWYLRLTVQDQRGIVARVAEIIAGEDINIESVEQEPQMPKDRLSFVITVQPVSEPTINRALNIINAFDFMVEPVLLLRIEN